MLESVLLKLIDKVDRHSHQIRPTEKHRHDHHNQPNNSWHYWQSDGQSRHIKPRRDGTIVQLGHVVINNHVPHWHGKSYVTCEFYTTQVNLCTCSRHGAKNRNRFCLFAYAHLNGHVTQADVAKQRACVTTVTRKFQNNCDAVQRSITPPRVFCSHTPPVSTGNILTTANSMFLISRITSMVPTAMSVMLTV